VVKSLTHTIDAPSNKTTIKVTWETVVDKGEKVASGVDGYSIIWNKSSDTTPNDEKNLEPDATSSSFEAKQDGKYWVHLKAVDKAGNWSEPVRFGPFIIDTVPPVIKDVTVEGKPYRVGAKITITMSGDPKGTAKFSLGNVAQDVTMKEGPDGIYKGTYIVAPDVVKQKVAVTVILSDVAGNETQDESEEVFLMSVDVCGKLFITWSHLKNVLYQNYPNPFNPETWIPYELARTANVTIRIFNIQGQLIRTLNIGRREAGLYLNKERAAYWDGQSNAGEEAASGVYFYTIQAGDFTATRKLVVLR